MSNRKPPTRGTAGELVAAIEACRAALDRGDITGARLLEHEIQVFTLRAIAGDAKRPRRLALMALALAAMVDERAGITRPPGRKPWRATVKATITRDYQRKAGGI